MNIVKDLHRSSNVLSQSRSGCLLRKYRLQPSTILQGAFSRRGAEIDTTLSSNMRTTRFRRFESCSPSETTAGRDARREQAGRLLSYLARTGRTESPTYVTFAVRFALLRPVVSRFVLPRRHRVGAFGESGVDEVFEGDGVIEDSGRYHQVDDGLEVGAARG